MRNSSPPADWRESLTGIAWLGKAVSVLPVEGSIPSPVAMSESLYHNGLAPYGSEKHNGLPVDCVRCGKPKFYTAESMH